MRSRQRVHNLLAERPVDRLSAVNVRGVCNMGKMFLPEMAERKSGVPSNLASSGAGK